MFYFMKTITKVLSLILALTLLLSFPVAASAVELTNVPTIDESKIGSLTIYKYDLTNAEKDGVWERTCVPSSPASPMVSIPIGCWCAAPGFRMRRLRCWKKKALLLNQLLPPGKTNICKVCCWAAPLPEACLWLCSW